MKGSSYDAARGPRLSERELFFAYRSMKKETSQMIQTGDRDPVVVTHSATGDFTTIRVTRDQLPPARVEHEHDDAVATARAQARGLGFDVVDVAAAVYQDSGDWLVELQVKTGDELEKEPAR